MICRTLPSRRHGALGRAEMGRTAADRRAAVRGGFEVIDVSFVLAPCDRSISFSTDFELVSFSSLFIASETFSESCLE